MFSFCFLLCFFVWNVPVRWMLKSMSDSFNVILHRCCWPICQCVCSVFFRCYNLVWTRFHSQYHRNVPFNEWNQFWLCIVNCCLLLFLPFENFLKKKWNWKLPIETTMKHRQRFRKLNNHQHYHQQPQSANIRLTVNKNNPENTDDDDETSIISICAGRKRRRRNVTLFNQLVLMLNIQRILINHQTATLILAILFILNKLNSISALIYDGKWKVDSIK